MTATEELTPPIAEHAPLALELEDLDVVYEVRGRDRQVLRGVTLSVKRGEAYGLVGESGCGKSTAALAIVNYLPRNGRVRSGGLRIDGRDALSLSESQLRKLRSESVSMVYQNPGAALNPSIRVGKQVAEVFRIRGEKSSAADDLARACARARADRRSRLRDGALPASALRRHAAARRDRDGARDRAGAAHPRRADDRPRRDGRGGGARPRRRPAVAAAHVRALHQPQPRDHPQDVRPRRRALRRQARRGGRDGDACSRIRGTRTPSASCAASRAAACGRITAGSTRSRASCRTSARICPAASSPGAASSPRRAARTEEPEAVRHRRRPHEPLPLPRAGADASARADRGARAAGDRPRRRPAAPLRRPRQGLQAAGPRRARARRRLGRDLARRDARPRRRVGQRQDDARARAARARAADDGRGRARRQGARAARSASARARTCGRCRSSSRTPTRRSTAATRCAGSCSAR